MRAEAVVVALLKANANIVAKVGGRVYLTRIAENDPYPAMVVEMVSGNPIGVIDASAGPQIVQARIQVTALGKNVNDVKMLLEYARQACEFKSGLLPAQYNGGNFNVQVQSIVRDTIGPDLKDDQLAVYYQSHDYAVTFWDKDS